GHVAVGRRPARERGRGRARLHAGAVRRRDRQPDHLAATRPAGRGSNGRRTREMIRYRAGSFPPRPPMPPPPPPRPHPAIQPTRVWVEQGEWPGRLYERLLNQRIVMAAGWLDGEAATRLCAQLLTLDAEGEGPIRLELHNLDADLPAALTVMGVLDTLRVAVTAYAGGRTSRPGLGA